MRRRLESSADEREAASRRSAGLVASEIRAVAGAVAGGRHLRPRGEICEVRCDPRPTGQGDAWASWRSGLAKGRECAVGLRHSVALLLKTGGAFQLRGEGEKELAAAVSAWRRALGGA
jgi:hypothetical protein